MTFVDAFQQAYGVAVCIWCEYHNDAIPSRRGVPKKVINDRQEFRSCSGQIKETSQQQQLQRKTVELAVTWRFNPPTAPHFGGAHEVMVKAAKKAIYSVVGDRDVTDEDMITVFAGVTSLLNSRPLTYHSSDPRDDVPLTPNHFLHGQMEGQLPLSLLKPLPLILIKDGESSGHYFTSVEEMAQRMCSCPQQLTKVDVRIYIYVTALMSCTELCTSGSELHYRACF